MLSYSEIARLEELRQVRGLADIAPEHITIAGGTVARSVPTSWTNNAVGVGLTEPLTPAELDRLIDYFTSRGIEPRMEACPFVHSSAITLPAEAGFRLRLFENLFFRELDPAAPAAPVVPTPDDLEIVRVDPGDAAMIREFSLTAASGFLPPGMAPNEEDLETSARAVRHPHTIGLMARVGGKAAGAGAMAVSGEIAGFFGVSVLPEFRRQGIQQALLARRINLAAARGARVATIGSLPGAGTERNARRMGFQLAYTKVVLVRPGPGLVPNIG